MVIERLDEREGCGRSQAATLFIYWACVGEGREMPEWESLPGTDE